ncbi:MAG: FapA family protein, partial [Spirochaetales bacterium]|nr:FapA family protein [Spirochaetales bacterium]
MGTVKGKIELLINPQKTQARLVFTPGSPGEVWDLQKILNLLDQERIKYGINRDSIQKALDLFGDAKEKTRSNVIAQGTKPKVRGVTFALTDREVSEDLRRIISIVIRRAAPPKFKEKVNPKLKGVTYVVKGEKVGTLSDPETLEAGVNVFGKDITPADLPGGEFYVGKDIEKKSSGDLSAGKTGIIRLGENWIDLLPFENHRWEITYSKDGSTPFLQFVPGMRSFAAPEGHKILQEALEQDFNEDDLVDGEEIDGFIAKAIDTRKPGKLSLMKSRDALVRIDFDPLKTSARLVLKKGVGQGKALSLNVVSSVLNESKLRGLETEKTKIEIMDFYRSSRLEASIPLCESVKPERGKDREVRFSVDFLEDSYRELLMDKVELDPSLVSFYESIKKFPMERITKLANVEKDQKIFALSADAKGKDGVDVFGKPIPGLSGNDPILNLYENIDYKSGTGTALISGLLEAWEDEETHTWHARIREHKNAPVDIHISENKMTASLSIGLPEGTGFSADRNIILAALEKVGVKAGLLEEKIDEAAEASGLGEVVTGLVVAE